MIEDSELLSTLMDLNGEMTEADHQVAWEVAQSAAKAALATAAKQLEILPDRSRFWGLMLMHVLVRGRTASFGPLLGGPAVVAIGVVASALAKDMAEQLRDEMRAGGIMDVSETGHATLGTMGADDDPKRAAARAAIRQLREVRTLRDLAEFKTSNGDLLSAVPEELATELRRAFKTRAAEIEKRGRL